MKRIYIIPENRVHEISPCRMIAESPFSLFGGGSGDGSTPEARRRVVDDYEEDEGPSTYYNWDDDNFHGIGNALNNNW